MRARSGIDETESRRSVATNRDMGQTDGRTDVRHLQNIATRRLRFARQIREPANVRPAVLAHDRQMLGEGMSC